MTGSLWEVHSNDFYLPPDYHFALINQEIQKQSKGLFYTKTMTSFNSYYSQEEQQQQCNVS